MGAADRFPTRIVPLLPTMIGVRVEIAVCEKPMAAYARRPRVRAWVGFGLEAVRLDAKLVRSTPTAAGIEFRADRIGPRQDG